MDSITKLRGKLAEAEDILQYVSKELEGYSTKDAEEHLNFAELKLRGEQYAFCGHPLTDKLFCDDYLALMIYLISLGGKKEEGWTVLYRIAAGCDYQGELQNLTTDAMTFTEERLSDLIREIYSAELANTFAIDSLMISHHMGADDAQLKFLAGVYELLKLNKNFLTEAIQFVKVYDYCTFWDNLVKKCQAWKILTAKDTATYIGGYSAKSLEETAKLKYKRVVISNITYTSEDVLYLDSWKAKEIFFRNCRFENCGGIASDRKTVKFVNCTFDGNIERWIPSPSEGGIFNHVNYIFGDPKYTWSYAQYSAYRGFLHFKNADFLSCSFKNFRDNVPMLYLNGGSIHSCIFESCHGSGTLIYTSNAQVKRNEFIGCYTSSGKKNSQLCMFYSKNSEWEKCIFLKCRSGVDSFNYDIKFNCILLMDENSNCTDCSFEENSANSYRELFGNRNSWSAYVIGLHDSEQSNNKGDFTVGETDFISKDIFRVGDKEYSS